MASYRVLIKASAAKELEALPNKKILQRLVERIRALADDPRPASSEKLSSYDDRYRVRKRVYRVVYLVSDEDRLVYVVKVGHRRDVSR